jgi:cobalamin biosynthesis protein CobT
MERKVARMELERLTQLALACVREDGKDVKVRLGRTWSYDFDRNTISVAPLIDGDYDAAKGVLNHEAGHAKFSDHAVVRECVERGDAFLKECVNVVEDVLVENLMMERYPGARYFIDRSVELTTKHGRRDEDLSPLNKRLMYAYLRARGYKTGLSFPELDPLLADMAACRESGMKTTFALGERLKADAVASAERELAERKREEREEREAKAPKPQPREEMDRGDDEGLGEEPEKEPEKEPGPEKEKEPEPEPEYRGGGTEPNAIEEKLLTAEEAREREEAAAEAAKMADDFEGDGGVMEAVKELLGEQVDAVLVEKIEEETLETKWIRSEEIPSEFSEDWGSRRRKGGPYLGPIDVGALTRQAVAKVRNVLVEEARVKRAGGLKAGKLHSRNLHRLRCGDRRVFSDKRRGFDVTEIAVAVVVDMSGSMDERVDGARTKMEDARETAMVLGETLNALGIRFGVYGYTTVEGKHRDPIEISFKEFDEPWRARRDELNRLIPCNNNMDGHSVWEVYRKLAAVNARHRMMFVVSDGRPAPEKNAVLERTVLEMMRSVDVIGFGLNYHSIAAFYPENCVCSANELPVKMAEKLRSLVARRWKGARAG